MEHSEPVLRVYHHASVPGLVCPLGFSQSLEYFWMLHEATQLQTRLTLCTAQTQLLSTGSQCLGPSELDPMD